jgi:hypothetical protein
MLVAVLLYLQLGPGVVRQYKFSPDGRIIAECREYNNLSTVELRTTSNPFRDTVIASLYDAGFSLTWVDSRTLLVDCNRCGEVQMVGRAKAKWREVRIRYAPGILIGTSGVEE